MKEIHVCPSTLAEGYETYSSAARKILFDGKVVSHYIDAPSPSEDSAEAKEAIRNVGRISLYLLDTDNEMNSELYNNKN